MDFHPHYNEVTDEELQVPLTPVQITSVGNTRTAWGEFESDTCTQHDFTEVLLRRRRKTSSKQNSPLLMRKLVKHISRCHTPSSTRHLYIIWLQRKDKTGSFHSDPHSPGCCQLTRAGQWVSVWQKEQPSSSFICTQDVFCMRKHSYLAWSDIITS